MKSSFSEAHRLLGRAALEYAEVIKDRGNSFEHNMAACEKLEKAALAYSIQVLGRVCRVASDGRIKRV